MYDNFIEFVNSQIQYNIPKDYSDGNSSLSVLAIPIVVYHNVAEASEGKLTIGSELLNKELKYLYDNNFKIKTMSDLKYNSTNDFLYMRLVPFLFNLCIMILLGNNFRRRNRNRFYSDLIFYQCCYLCHSQK